MNRRVGLLVVALAAPALAAADGPSVVVTQVDESKFPEIRVDFVVKRADGSFLPDARRDEFRVAEDGRDRPILRFEAPESTEVKPTTVVLVVDRSGSMKQEGKIDGLKRAVARFLEALPGGSKVAVIAFGDEVDLIRPFTTDRALVREAVDALKAEGGTRYFDAVDRALGLLAEQAGRRAVLALTDGQDTLSTLQAPGVVARARALGLPVHTLGFGDGREINLEALRELADGTRGQYHHARDVDQLHTIFEEIARSFRASYSLAYQSDRKILDGTLRPIRVNYARAKQAAEAAVFIPGMVVRASGWSPLYLALMAGLAVLAVLPAILRKRARAKDT